MNFYYDPILGLQYNYLGDLFLIDIEMIPQNYKFDAEKWIKYMREIGIQKVESYKSPIIETILNITNYKL